MSVEQASACQRTDAGRSLLHSRPNWTVPLMAIGCSASIHLPVCCGRRKGGVMDIQLDRDTTIPLYRQIVAQVIAQIENGRLPVGTLLPPERKLAERLGVNRTTVVTAYRELVATGMVE